MGASESSEPRHVSLERDGEQMIVITEDVIRRLEGKESSNKENISGSNGDLKQAWSELEREKRNLIHQSERIHELLQEAFEEGQKVEARRHKGETKQHDENEESRLQKTLEEKEKDLAEDEKSHMEQLKALETKYADQIKVNEDQFNTAVDEVQKKFRHRHTAPVCQNLQNNVMDCYTNSPKQPLKCSQEVKKFIECVKTSRLSALTSSN